MVIETTVDDKPRIALTLDDVCGVEDAIHYRETLFDILEFCLLEEDVEWPSGSLYSLCRMIRWFEEKPAVQEEGDKEC